MKRLKISEKVDWHITLRGTRRLLLFHDGQDYTTFYRLLREASVTSGTTPVANCVMSNHFHLCQNATSDELTFCMHRLDRAYAGYYNKRYGLSGHAYEASYHAEPILSDFIRQRVIRYIHLNPVRGGKATRPEEYPWSNYTSYIWGTDDFLDSDIPRILNTFDPVPGVARRAYRAFLEEDLKRPLRPIVGKTPASELWQEHFRWLAEFTEAQAKFLEPLDPVRVAVYWAVNSGIPPRAIGRVLGHPDGRSASQIAYKLSVLLRNEPPLRGKLVALGIPVINQPG